IYRYEGLSAMQKTDDWVTYALNLKFEEDPGVRYEYSNISTFLLAAVLQNATGMDVLAFANTHLFQNLGIQVDQWEKSPKGITKAWARLWLKPDDMAKIGLLVLQKGQWNGKQVIPSQWIEESLVAHATPFRYRKVYNKEGEWDTMASGSHWFNHYFMKPFSDGYGYKWWLDDSGVFSAVGTGGQYIICNPEKDLIVVFTSKLFRGDVVFPAKLYREFLLDSVVSDSALPPNPNALQSLKEFSEPPAFKPSFQLGNSVDNIADEISGKSYRLTNNYFNHDNLRLEFDKIGGFTTIHYTAKESDRVSYKIGMEGQVKLTTSNGLTYASYGFWESSHVFRFHTEIVGYSAKDRWKLTFEDNKVLIEEFSVVGTQHYEGVFSQKH
ncbi:MAG: serine hydrolase, partial [Deltaproteobacteria bacterium]|nr:serine hydrolase [Deltaproteobacteria bacterium]